MIFYIFNLIVIFMNSTLIESFEDSIKYEIKLVDYEKIINSSFYNRILRLERPGIFDSSIEIFCNDIFDQMKKDYIEQVQQNYQYFISELVSINEIENIKFYNCINEAKNSATNVVLSKFENIQNDLNDLIKKIYLQFLQNVGRINNENFQNNKEVIVDYSKNKNKMSSANNSRLDVKVESCNEKSRKVNLTIKNLTEGGSIDSENKVVIFLRTREVRINELFNNLLNNINLKLTQHDGIEKKSYFSLEYQKLFEALRLAHCLLYNILRILRRYILNNLRNVSFLMTVTLKYDGFQDNIQEFSKIKDLITRINTKNSTSLYSICEKFEKIFLRYFLN